MHAARKSGKKAQDRGNWQKTKTQESRGREREELATCQNARYLRFAILLHSLLNNLLRPL